MGRQVGNVVSRGFDGRKVHFQDFKEDALIKQKEEVRESCLRETASEKGSWKEGAWEKVVGEQLQF